MSVEEVGSNTPSAESDPWYVRFFRRDYLRIYGHTLEEDRTELETQFAIRALGIIPHDAILDLCCGQGRHSIALAKTGLEVTGVDLSSEMLDLARSNATASGVSLSFRQADMRFLPQEFTSRFDAIINMFSSFGYLESESDDQLVLNEAARVLKPDGKLLMDLLNREWVIINNEPYEWRIHDDGTIILEHRELDLEASINHLTYTEVAPDGTRTAVSELHMRLYTLTEMIEMLKSAGLRLERVYGGFRGEGYGVNTRRMIIVASKS